MIPALGRIVHYHQRGRRVCAAVIVGLHEAGVVDLCILTPGGIFFDSRVAHAQTASPRAGCWSWPPREAP